jgi:hypothetical protein
MIGFGDVPNGKCGGSGTVGTCEVVLLEVAARFRDRCFALLASKWNGCGRLTLDFGSSWRGKYPLWEEAVSNALRHGWKTYPGMSPLADSGSGGVSAGADSGSRKALRAVGSSMAIGLLRVDVRDSEISVIAAIEVSKGKHVNNGNFSSRNGCYRH